MSFDKEVSFTQVRLRLQALGFKGISQRRNHAKFIRICEGCVQTAILPHYTELTPWVVQSILRQASVSEAEFNAAEI